MAIARELTIKWNFQYDKAQVEELKKNITIIKNLATAAGASLAGMSNRISTVARSATQSVKQTTQAVKELHRTLAQPVGPIFPMARGMGEGFAAFRAAANARRTAIQWSAPTTASSPYSYLFSTRRTALTSPGINWSWGREEPSGMRNMYGGWSGPRGLLGYNPSGGPGEVSGEYSATNGLKTIVSKSLGLNTLGAISMAPAFAQNIKNSMMAPMRMMQGLPLIGGIATGAGLTKMLHESLRSYSEITALEHSLGQVTGSKQTASMLIGQARAYTRAVPGADLEQTVKNMHIFLGSGVAASDVMGRMRKITDLSAMFSANFTRIAADFAKIQQRGYMTGYEFTSFIRNKIPMNKAIADVLGINANVVPELVKGKAISNEIVLAALNKLAGPGGIAYGFTAQKAKTPEGQIQIFRQIFKDFERSVGGIIAPEATNILKKLLDFFNRNENMLRENLAKIFTIMIDSLPILAQFATFMINNWEIIAGYLGILVALTAIENAQSLLIFGAIVLLKDAVIWLKNKLTEFYKWTGSPETMAVMTAMPQGPGYALMPKQAGAYISGMNITNHVMIDGSNLPPDQLSKAVQVGLDNHTKNIFHRAATAFAHGIDTVGYAPASR